MQETVNDFAATIARLRTGASKKSLTTLYRLFSAENTLLYVGISSRVEQRFFCQHLFEKDWWREVERSTFEHFDYREHAEAAEVKAIETEVPVYNIAHNELGPNIDIEVADVIAAVVKALEDVDLMAAA
jgi:hypothetical protein